MSIHARKRPFAVVVAGLLLVALATSAVALGGSGRKAAAPLIPIGLVMPGPTNDKGYNEGNYAGLVASKKLGYKISWVENAGSPTNALDAMKNLASKNKLVLIAGGQYADIAKTAAAAYPQTKFVVMDGSPSDKTRPKNLSAYLVAEWQPAYVTGAIAAKLTKTKTIGYLGGLDIPTTANTGKGYEAGAKSVGGVEVLSTNIGSFDDVAKAKEAAAAQIAGGADVLFTFLDAANPGVYSAIADSGKAVKVIVGVRIKSICADSKYAAGWTLANYGKRVQIAAADFKKGNGTLPAVKILDMKIPNMEELNLCRGTSTPALVKLQGTIKKNILNGKIKNPL